MGELLDRVLLQVGELRKYELELVRKECTRQIGVRYPLSRKGVLRRGNIDPCFTERELDLLFAQASDPFYRAVLRVLQYLGLRIGEAVRLRPEHVLWRERKLRVDTLKGGTVDFLHLHPAVYEVLVGHFERFGWAIQLSGYVFFGQNASSHISTQSVRAYFRKIRKQAGLDYAYCRVANSKRQFCYRLTLHSFRHSFAQRIRRETGDVHMVQRLLRHRDLNSTAKYLHARQGELDRVMEKAFWKKRKVFVTPR